MSRSIISIIYIVDIPAVKVVSCRPEGRDAGSGI